MKDSYIGLVRWMVKRPGLVVLIFCAVILLAGWEFVRRPTGFLPIEDHGFAVVITRLPPAAAQSRSQEIATKVDDILKKTPGIATWVTIGGFSFLDSANVSTINSTFIVFESWSQRGAALSQEKIVESLNRKFAGFQGAQVFVSIPTPIRGLGQAGGFEMMVEDRAGLGLAQLQKSVNQLIDAGNAHPNLRGLTTTFSARSPQLYLEIDRTNAESMQVPISNLFDTLRSYLGSSFVNLFNKFNQVFQVYIQANDRYRLEDRDIQNLYLRNGFGEMVPLGTLIRFNWTQGSDLITRYNLYPAAAVFGSAAPGFSSGQALKLMEQVAAHTLPAGMSYSWAATSYQEKKAGYQAYFIYALSVTLVFLVLAALFESWASPAAVILAVPMAVVGILLAIIIRGCDNNLYTHIGLVLMIALASKNAILIVEFARDLHRQGMSATEAAVEATGRRFRPFVMTSFAFILGVFL